MSGQQAALFPSAPFYVVKLGASGIHYGPFLKPAAERFAAVHGHPTSNFVIPVRPEGELPLSSRLAAVSRALGVPTENLSEETEGSDHA